MNNFLKVIQIVRDELVINCEKNCEGALDCTSSVIDYPFKRRKTTLESLFDDNDNSLSPNNNAHRELDEVDRYIPSTFNKCPRIYAFFGKSNQNFFLN